MNSNGNFSPTPRCFRDTVKRLSNQPAYFVRSEKSWQPCSWTQYGEQVEAASRALIALGIGKGDVVCILGFNRPEWAIMDLAAMAVGATAAGIYWTCAPVEVEYVLEHSKARVLLVENANQYEKIRAARSHLSHLQHVIIMSEDCLPEVMAWQDFLLLGHQKFHAELQQRLANIQADDLGCLIYTSGTTGAAKAVMLSHGSLAWVRQSIVEWYVATDLDRLLSYLPMAHIAEQMGAIHAQAEAGFAIYYARSIESVPEHLKEVRPTIFFGVPRVWEKMHATIDAKLALASRFKRTLALWAFKVMRKWHAHQLNDSVPSWWLNAQKKLANHLVHRKLKAAMGLDQARLLITGASSIAKEHLIFFSGLDLMVRELYGQSETCGPITVSGNGSTRFGSVGKALPGTEIRIVDNEVQVRGPHVFSGYLGRIEESEKVFDQDWLLTGDYGRFDDEGYLYITGRKRDLIITSGGKNISPANLEADLMSIAFVEHAVVCGDNRHYLVALLSLKPEAVQQFASEYAIAIEAVWQHPELLGILQNAIDEVNNRHARVEAIRKFALIEKSLSIDDAELTPTMKVRRQVVIERNQALIDDLYL